MNGLKWLVQRLKGNGDLELMHSRGVLSGPESVVTPESEEPLIVTPESVKTPVITPEYTKTPMITPEGIKTPVVTSDQQQQGMDYMMGVASQENQGLLDLPDDAIIMPNVAPEKDGGMDIAFGHKLTPEEAETKTVYGIDISNGITKDQAFQILQLDIEKKMKDTRRIIGPDKFDTLPTPAKEALTDLHFTGVLNSFPSFKEAILTGNKEKAYKEYKRKFTNKQGQKVEMKRRNNFMRSILDRLTATGYLKGK